MGIKKGTKLTNTPKDIVYQMRVDEETDQKVKIICEKEKISKSELIRQGIDLKFRSLESMRNIDISQIERYKEEFLQRIEEIDILDVDEETKQELKEIDFRFFQMLVLRDYDVKNKFHFEAKKKTVMAGVSPIFKNWQEHSTITIDDFLEALAWVCDDPKDGGDRKCKLTREIALTPTGIKKLKRVYGRGFVETVEVDTGKRWEGEFFEQDCDKNISITGKIRVVQKICINAQTDLR